MEADLGSGPGLVGVNTAQPHALVAEAIAAGLIPQLRDYATVRREVKYGQQSRIDFLLEDARRPSCYLEVKNVHLMRQPRLAEFPDSVTARGTRHLHELARMRAGSARAVMLYVIQIPSADRFAIARDIDRAYGAAFEAARGAGVEMLAWRCSVGLAGIEIAAPVPDHRRLTGSPVRAFDDPGRRSGGVASGAHMLTLTITCGPGRSQLRPT